MTLNIQHLSLSAPSRKPQGTLLVKTAPSKPPASFLLSVELQWANVSGVLTMRDGNVAALLYEEVFPPAWKKHHLALLDHLEFGKGSKCLRMHPRIDEVFSCVYCWLEKVLIGVFPVDGWPFQLSVGKKSFGVFPGGIESSGFAGIWCLGNESWLLTRHFPDS